MTKQHWSSAAILALAAASCATMESVPPAELSAYASGLQPGCGAAVFDASPRFSATGYADLSRQTPIDRDTRFPIGSVSKQFTALVVLHLAETGQLSLDAPASRYVPELSGALGGATVRQLLNQTAGVRDHTSLLIMTGVETLGVISREQSLALLARQHATNFVPGARAQYSNGNFLILSEIASRVSGESFETLTTRLIFRPLRMTNTGFIGNGERATGYRPTRDGFITAEDMPSASGPGGVVTTLADLQRFDADFRRGSRVWTPWIKQQMLTPAQLTDGTQAIMPEFDSAYGMGLALGSRNDVRYAAHDGGVEGFRAEYIRALDQNLSVAVLCNRADADASTMAFAIFEEALNLPTAPNEQAPEAAPQTSAAQPTPAPGELLARIAGVYHSDELNADFNIVAIPGGLEATISSPYSAEPVEDTWGAIRVAGEDLRTGPLRIHPVIESGQVSSLRLSFGRRAEGVVLTRR